MCSCSYRSGGVAALQQSGFQTIIPQNNFIAGDLYYEFSFFTCVNREKVVNKLNEVQFKDQDGKQHKLGEYAQDDNGIKWLSQLAQNGSDIKQLGVSIKNKLYEIKFTDQELNNSACTVAFGK